MAETIQNENLSSSKPKRLRRPPSSDPTKTNKNKPILNNEPRPAKFEPTDIRNTVSILGSNWNAVYQHAVEFGASHFEKAMANIILEPNLNSTSIMRTDVLSDNLSNPDAILDWLKSRGITEKDNSLLKHHDSLNENSLLDDYCLLKLINPETTSVDPQTMPLSYNIDDIASRDVDTDLVSCERKIVRRIIPRNPQRDPIINQTCAIHTHRIDKLNTDTNLEKASQDSVLVIYIPHINSPDQCPFYLPPAKAVGVLYHDYTLSVHYLLFDDCLPGETDQIPFMDRDPTDRMIRIALHLLDTSYKHSFGAKSGYKKRVYHDMVVPKVVFQDRYIDLKARYAKELVSNWVESTDPKKHVFEDLAIAAFIIELWNQTYKSKSEFSFVDIGCGNGLLVNILLKEGYTGYGIDARARKSWPTYSDEVKKHLHEQVIVPRVLIDQPATKYHKLSINTESEDHNIAPGTETKKTPTTCIDLLSDPGINTADFPENSFLIGNHSDELTCWMPLFNRPFIVIPCCSYSLAGSKCRYTPKTPEGKSTYASLVDHVQGIATAVGWDVEKEILRIPSTRNSAIICRQHVPTADPISVLEVIENEDGANGWVERTMALRSKNPRNH